MNKVRLGIIGCGIAARELHLPALKKLHTRFTIACVCNHTEPKAREFAKLAGGVPYVLDYHELLRRDDIDAVDIVLPIDLNFAVTRDALKARKHVIVEKPLAANLAEGRKMLAFPRQYRRVMMVAENFRYRPLFHRVRDLLTTGAIGRPYAVIWNVLHQLTPENRYVRTQWRIRHKYPGGFITDGGVHNIAALRLLFGEITSGVAFSSTVNPQIGRTDTMSFQFAARGGVHGVLNIFCSAMGYSEHKLLVLGDAATMTVVENTITIQRRNKPDIREIVDDDGGFEAEFADFFLAITKQHKVTSTFSEAYRDLEVILGALASATTGKRMSLRA